MGHKFSLSIFHNTNHYRKHFTFSRSAFVLGCLAAVAGVALTGYFFFQSRALKQTISEPAVLLQRIAHQREQIDTREQHLALVKEKLNKLDTRLAQLGTFEKQVREIARIEPAINHDNLFGVGGARNKTSDQEKNMPINPGISLDDMFLQQQADKNIPWQLSNQPAGFTLVFETTNFSINPITGIPSLLPVNKDIENSGDGFPTAVGITECRRGISLSAPADSYIVAPSNGIAAYTGENSALKKILIIDHGHGFITRYTGFDRISIKTGERVFRGDRIGVIEATPGTETPSPFYYEILLNGLPVNPEKYLSRGPFLL